MKDVYIAGPLFNPAQIKTLEMIENICDGKGLSFYAPRFHSGSHLLTKDEKKDFTKWEPVFLKNRTSLLQVKLVLAVLSYELPDDTHLGIATDLRGGDGWTEVSGFTQIEIPDTGTVWEMGFAHSMKVPVVGFHPHKTPDKLNLMLSHSCDWLICGYPALHEFLAAFKMYKPSELEKFTPANVLGAGKGEIE